MNHVVFVLFLLSAVLNCSAKAEVVRPSRYSLPISQMVLPNGIIRYSIPIALGSSQPVQALLDTGSTGVRFLPGVVPESAYKVTDPARSYEFASGVKLRGVLASGILTIGAVRSLSPISVQIVQSIGCVAGRRCTAWQSAATDFGLGGNGVPKAGFRAIVGLSLRKGVGPSRVAPNPLPAIGASSWIISVPLPDQTVPGTLILNPSKSDLEGFAIFQLEREHGGTGAGWDDQGLPGCVTNNRAARAFCGRTGLDTGAPGIYVVTTTATEFAEWEDGIFCTLSFHGAALETVSGDFVTRRASASTVTVVPTVSAAQERIDAGATPYLLWVIYYNADQGLIGLRPRSMPKESASIAQPLPVEWE